MLVVIFKSREIGKLELMSCRKEFCAALTHGGNFPMEKLQETRETTSTRESYQIGNCLQLQILQFLYFQQGDSYDEFSGMLISVLSVRDSNILFIRAVHISADFHNCSLFFLHDLVGSPVVVMQGKHGILITCRTNTLPFNS